jgi:hypothetical protein
MWRAGPTLSATTSAQKPGGSWIPPLSGSHAGAVAPGRLHAIASKKAALFVAAGHLLFNMKRKLVRITLYRIQDMLRPCGSGGDATLQK